MTHDLPEEKKTKYHEKINSNEMTIEWVRKDLRRLNGLGRIEED